MKIKTFTAFASIATLLFLSLLLAVVYYEKNLHSELVSKENHRYRALAIAKELLQSSEDLTRMARSYVVTGDTKYERYFHDILEIRDGKLPRPHNYSSTYWHLAGIGVGLSPSFGDHYSLHELTRLAGLSTEAKALLRQSQENSDGLVDMERQAFAAMKGVFDDGSGEYLLRRSPDQAFAIALLYGEDYADYKAKIMAPIEKFITYLSTREQTHIDHLQHQLERIILFKIMLLTCMIVGVLIGIYYMRKKILVPLTDLSFYTSAIAKGNYRTSRQIASNDELSKLNRDINTMVKTIVKRNAERDEVERQLDNNVLNLNERIKELQCLYRLSDLGQIDTISLDVFFDRAVNLLPQAWHLPEAICARIIFDKQVFQAGINKESQWKIIAPILLHGMERGKVEIIYTGENNGNDPFLPEEHKLLTTIADQIPQIIGRRLSEEALQSSTIRLAAILDNVVDGIITINEYGTIKSFNLASEKIFGYNVDEVLGQNVKMLMPEPYHSEHDKYLSNYLETKKKKIIGHGREVVGKRKDGTTFPMDLAVSEMLIGNEKVYCGIVRDITQRKKIEIQLQETLELTEAILVSANFSIISTDLDGTILSFNSMAEKMLGYSADEVIGKHNPCLFHDANEIKEQAEYLTNELGMRVKPGFKVFVTKVMAGIPYEHEWTYFDKNRNARPVSLSVTALRDEGNQIKGYLMIASDISERKRVEQMKNEFVSTVSHELRTPLTSIRGSLGLIIGSMNKDLPPNVLKLIDVANTNSERLILLVNDILDMEKIEAGKMSLMPEVKELDVLLHQAVELTQAYANQYKVTIDLNNPLKNIKLNIDVNRFIQILANLISNAAKFSPQGETICINTEERSGVVRIAVSDKGHGITEEFSSHIFNKFSQEDSSDTRKKGGTGLGLSITKSLVEKMGGKIDFESEPNVLTTFYIEFPIIKDETLLGSGDVEVWNESQTDSVVMEKRLLVCEDDKHVANFLKLLLEEQVQSVDIAHNAAQAKKMLAENNYDLMTLDIGLPDQNGIELINELRANDATRDMPVVVVSVYPSEDYKDQFNASVFRIADWLVKPIEKELLQQSIKRVVDAVDSKNKKILQVENDADILHIVKAFVDDVAELDQVKSLHEAKQMMTQTHYDLIILDVNLSNESSGLELLPVLDDNPTPTPVLIFSSDDPDIGALTSSNTMLTQSCTDNLQLLKTIKRLIGSE